MTLPILFQNEDIVIINKPTGISCHNDLESVISHLKNNNQLDLHLVNRLDKETSGILVLCKEPKNQNTIQMELQKGEKKYLTILRGKMTASLEYQEWNFPISDKGEGRDNPQGLVSDQKASLTKYKCLKSNDYFSLVECIILTGRQHQIRKHAKIFGKPIVGDDRYGNPKDTERIKKLYGFNRLALHSYELNFIWKNEKISIATDAPKEFNILIC